MTPRTLRALCAALGLALAGVATADSQIRGRHLDDGSTYLHGRAPNTEDRAAPTAPRRRSGSASTACPSTGR